MKTGSSDRYASIEAALNEVGLKVEEIKKLNKKTVITVLRIKQGDVPKMFHKNMRQMGDVNQTDTLRGGV